jgi:hypothetical protein
MRALEPPRPVAEQVALQWAAEFFRERGSEMTPEGSAFMAYDPDTLIEMYDNGKESQREFDIYLRRVLGLSLTSGIHGDAARCEIADLVAELIERGDPLPNPVKTWVVKFLRRDDIFYPPKKPGPDATVLAHRNVCICEAAEHIAKTWNFDVTRNVATDRASAASIVREGLREGAGVNLTEKAINKVCAENRFLFENGRGPS